MKKTSIILVLILFIGINQSCSTIKTPETNAVNEPRHVATILGQPVTLEELKMGYNGVPDSNSVDLNKLRDFLPSYVDYRLKIKEGRQLGYFKDPDILAEYNTFAKEAAEKQWINSEVETRILDTFISRSKKELLAYHILITAQETNYEESREIKNQLSAAKNEILGGNDPDSVNSKYSSVQNGNYAGGSLPWITAGRTVKSFEDVLYSLEPGDVSDPFQTQFGFHIIYLKDERPRTSERLVSHLFVAKQGKERPDEIISQALDSLKNGVEWDSVVDEYSDDRRTAARNGEIGWVGYGMQFPEPFVDEVMNVPAYSSFSEIIDMDYGFHIVKVDSVRNLADRETLEEYAKSELSRLGRLQPGKDELYKMLEEYGNLNIYDEEFSDMADYLLGNTDTLQNKSAIAEFNNKTILADQFVDFYRQEADKNSDKNTSITDAFEQYKERLIESNLIELTKDRFDDYRLEMEQFLNGLVVFKVNEEFLWNSDAADEQLMRNHFKNNRTKYNTEETISYYRITASTDSMIVSAKNSLLENGDPDLLKEEFENIIVRTGSTTNRNPDLFQKLKQTGTGKTTDKESNNTWHQFYFITDIAPQRPKTFDEAKTEVFNEVREQHEHNYFEMLREKYQAKLFPENVE